MCVRCRGKIYPVFWNENGILAWFGKMMFDMVFEHAMMNNWSSNIQEKYLLRCLVKIHDLFSSRWKTRSKDLGLKMQD